MTEILSSKQMSYAAIHLLKLLGKNPAEDGFSEAVACELGRCEIERLTREHLAEAAAHDTTRRERAEDVKEVSRLRAALGAALSGAIRYVGYDCADCGMQVLEGRSVCRKSGNPHTPPKNGLGSSAADEIERLRAALGRAKDQIKHSDNRCVCHEVYLILEDAQTLRGADETDSGK